MLSQIKGYVRLIFALFILGCLGYMFIYILSQPDCIRMTADGSIHCACEFQSQHDWNQFKENTKGLNHDGWEAVAFENGVNPCKTSTHADTSGRENNSIDNTKSESISKQYLEDSNKQPVDTQRKISLDIPMIKVEGGAFVMGSDTPNQNASPQHQVRLKTFYMSQYMISASQWDSVMENEFNSNSASPKTYVSWYAVQNFIKKLNKVTNKNYRLPTEAEWEYAAHGGNKDEGFIFSGSNDINLVHQSGRANELGIYDMTGVLWQWCSDWCDSTYYKKSPLYNPEGGTTGTMKIKRGGGFANRAENCTITFRHALEPERSDADIGFRLVLDNN